MQLKNYSKFKGKYLEDELGTIEVNFPEDEFKDYLFTEFKSTLKTKYNESAFLNHLTNEEDHLEGSTPQSVILVNELIRPLGLRTATLSDLERIIKSKTLKLEGFYFDSGFVLRDIDPKKDYFGENLKGQIKKNYPNQEFPVMINLCDMDLIRDRKSIHHISFEIRKDADLIHAPILMKDPDFFLDEDIELKTGLPKKLKNPNGQKIRMLYNGYECFSKVCLAKDLDIVTNNHYIEVSHPQGRIVIVKEIND